SIVIVCSPSACMSTTARRLRPIRRWISSVRPPCLPRAASRWVRVCVARGSMPYSAVTQPCCLPLRKGGTFGSTDAVQSTRVSPTAVSTEPSAWRVKLVSTRTARSSSARRPLGLFIGILPATDTAARAYGSCQPPRGCDRGVVAVRGVACDRTIREHAYGLRERRSVGARQRGDVAVLEARPEAVRANGDDVAGRELLAARHAHVGKRRIAA